MCGLGLMGLPMFFLVGVLLLVIFGLMVWYLTVRTRERLRPLPPKVRMALGSSLILGAVTLAVLGLILVRDFLITGPCPAP